MTQVRNDVENAKLELRSATEARDAYKKELAGESPTLLIDESDSGSGISTPEIDARLAALKKELDDFRRKYTDEHPDVASTKRLIEQLQDQKKEEVAARRKAASVKGGQIAPVDRNPVFQQLRISLAEAEANVASARAKVAAYENQYRNLRSQAQLVPQVEAEFAQLNRDYDVQKKTYEALLARRESAAMGKDVQDTGGASFRVIDPPRVSPEPVAPRRVALLGVAFAFALLLGFFSTFIANQVAPLFHDARSLRQLSKRPILGMVCPTAQRPEHAAPGDETRISLLAVSAACWHPAPRFSRLRWSWGALPRGPKERTMSLIEDAARRLEELRRAGVELPDDPIGAPKIAKGHGETPLPEAVVAAMEARRAESGLLAGPAARAERATALDRPGARPQADRAPGRAPLRDVDLNLDKLRSLGFATPDVPTSQTADEFRVIKRPIIRNAVGKADERVRHGNLVMVTSALPGEGRRSRRSISR
jgi:hypothetical protein